MLFRSTRDYVHVSDVAKATFLAATAPLLAAGKLDDRAFNIGTGVATSVNDLARILRAISGSAVPVEYGPARAGEQEHSFLEVSKAASVLGWRAETGLEAGLRQSYRWFEAQHHSQVVRT